MSAVHRVYAESRTAPAPSIVCPRCGHRNPTGQSQCDRCHDELFLHARERWRAVGEFSKRVTRGEEMPEVTGYLRAHGYPIGPSPETVWRRKRRLMAREIRRRRRERHERGYEA